MRHFMEYVQDAFHEATGWSRDSCYSSLNATSDALLAFPTPRGLRLSLSSLATAHFATSYQLGSVGIVDGSISYLFSSVPLAGRLTPSSAQVALPDLLRAYRPLSEIRLRGGGGPAGGSGENAAAESATTSRGVPTLLYGRLYLPRSMLEALLVARLSATTQAQLSAVSSPSIRNGGTALGLAQYDVGRYAIEGLASSDGGLLGLRGVYNFGGDLDGDQAGPADDRGAIGGGVAADPERERIYGRFTAGGEVYYGTLNKSGGVSVGARFATLPAHRGTPLVATLTLNPLVGSIAATYSVVAGAHCSLATRLDFNVYSYDSHWAVAPDPPRVRSFQAKMEWRLDDEPPIALALASAPTDSVLPAQPPTELTTGTAGGAVVTPAADGAAATGGAARAAALPPPLTTSASRGQDGREGDEFGGALKVRIDESLKLGLLWEGRVKSLLYSVGSGIDLRRLDQPFRTLGVEIQFSS